MNRTLPHVTVSPRVHSCGRDLVDANGNVIATARDAWTASALAELVEMGRPIAAAREQAFVDREATIRSAVFRAVKA